MDWGSGQYLVWDFTYPDTLAPSHVQSSASAVGSTAERAENGKRIKYAELVVALGDFIFMPVAVETMVTWGPSALELCADIGRRIASVSGDPRSHTFLMQRLSLAVQRGNVAAVVGPIQLGTFV